MRPGWRDVESKVKTMKIRIASLGTALLIALLANLTWVQVLDADNLRLQQGNTRLLLQQFNRSRGPILVGSEAVASSARAAGESFYQRSYTEGPLFAPITGFYSLIYGATGIERSANDLLSGSDSRFFVDRVQQLFAGRRSEGGAVRLTINKDAQVAAYKGLGTRAGAVVAVDPRDQRHPPPSRSGRRRRSPIPRAWRLRLPLRSDRKSTRLNSSH